MKNRALKKLLTALLLWMAMLLPYFVSCQGLLRHLDLSNGNGYVHTYNNPLTLQEVDTAVCLSLEYSKNLLYWGKRGINSTELIRIQGEMNRNLLNQIVMIDKQVYSLVNQNNALSKANLTLRQENNRLNNELLNSGTNLAREQAKALTLEDQLKKSKWLNLGIGGGAALLLVLLISGR